MEIHQTQVFMQDGAPCHTAKSVTTWIRDRGIDLLQWPTQSPELNPIENMWSTMKAKVNLHRFTTLNQLMEYLKVQRRTEVTVEECSKLVFSMPRRVAAVIKNKG